MKNEQMGAGIAEPPDETSPDALSSKTAAERAERDRRLSPSTDSSLADQPPGLPRSILREYFESLIVTAVMALFGMTFIVQAVKVPTGSMQNTILIGDHLLVNKFIFAPGETLPFLPQREIRRGDIIVFKYPGNPNDPERDRTDPTSQPFTTNFVKRVVGLPGDQIEVRGARVLINGQLLPEYRVTAEQPHEDDPDTPEREDGAELTILDNPPPKGQGEYTVYYSQRMREAENEGAELMPPSDFHHALKGKPEKVPAGHYFVMGDNRENSLDSRAWGFVPRDLVMGRAMFVYWSYDQSAPQSEGFFGLIEDFVNNTRWARTGTLIK